MSTFECAVTHPLVERCAAPETPIERLRRETRVEHDWIERDLDWKKRAETTDLYRPWLARLHGFYRAWEPAVAVALADPVFFEPRRKLHLLTADLVRLGATPGELDQAPAPAPLCFTSRSAALGSMYVLEGATLGGRVIRHTVQARLGFEPCYHSGYGAATGTMWRAFQHHMNGVLVGDQVTVAVTSARHTFVRLREWLTQPPLDRA